jgi:uncharacterized membrane protein
VRTLAYALIVFGVLHVASAFARHGAPVGIQLALQSISFGSFAIVAFSTAAGITNSKPALIATVIVLLLSIFPCNMKRLATAITPVGIGLLAGTGLRLALKQEKADAP